MAGRAVTGNRNFLMKDDTGKAGKVGVTVTNRAIRDSSRNVRGSSRNVRRVDLGIFADRHNTIVARITVISNRNDLMKDTTGKGTPRAVANNAIQCGHQVADRWLAGRRNTIVTGNAGYT